MNSRKQNKKKRYTVAIIGAGRIASGFDSPRSKNVLTHAHAIVKNPSLSLVGIMDIDGTKGRKEAHKWKTEYYSRQEDLLAQRPDVVVIATPDDTHARLLEIVSRAKPKLIICEKPVVVSKREIENLIKKVLPQKIPTIVNFIRRFDPTVRELRRALVGGQYGKVISANAVYTNGIFHNGSHMLDFAHFLFGEMKSAKGLFKTDDAGGRELSVGGIATFERCPQFSLMMGDERNYAVFELEIFAEKKRIRFSNFGFDLITQDVVSDPLYKGFRALSKPKQIKTELLHAMENLYTHTLEVLDGKADSLSSLRDAIKTQQACFQLLDSLPKS